MFNITTLCIPLIINTVLKYFLRTKFAAQKGNDRILDEFSENSK